MRKYRLAILVGLWASVFLLLAVVMAECGETTARKIVIFRDGASRGDMAVAMSAAKTAGARTIHDLSFVDAAAMELTPSAEAALLADPNVAEVIDDAYVNWLEAVDGDISDVSGGQVATWNIKHIHALSAQQIVRGKGVKVVVVDTGVGISKGMPHPDVPVAGGKSFVAYTADYGDDYGHGTHVAGIIAAADNDIGVIGVAPEAKIYSAKVLNFMGWGYLADVIKGVEYAIKIRASVINMSLGTNSDFPLFHKAVTKAYRAGVAVVCAAGNNWGGPVIYPAAYDEAVAVSATDIKDDFAYFSSAGPEVDVAAPGNEIYSAYIDVPLKKATYIKMSGTSMASPHVAGAVALLISKPNSVWTPKLLKQRLQETAKDLGGPGQDDFYGMGLLNAAKAVRKK